MTTRNLVPRETSQGKIGTSSKKWADVFANNGNFDTIKINSLKINSTIDLDLFLGQNGISEITQNANNQYIISLHQDFLGTSGLGFNNDGTKPDFSTTQNSVITATDSLFSAIEKLDGAMQNIVAPSNFNFDSEAILLSTEDYSNNLADNNLMTSQAINSLIEDKNYGNIQTLSVEQGQLTKSSLDNDLNITLGLDDTGVTANTYGSSTAIPSITVDSKGRITSATTNTISSSFNIVDSQQQPTTGIVQLGNNLTFNGTDDIDTLVNNSSLTISLNDTGVTANTYGSSTAIPSITVDSKGRITSATTNTISTGFTINSSNLQTEEFNLLNDTLSIEGLSGLESTLTKDAQNNIVKVELGLTDSGVQADTYGSATQIPSLSIDTKGRVTAVSLETPQITSSQITDASSANNINSVVKRDNDGNFSANTITANLFNGNSSTTNALESQITFELTGDITGSVQTDFSQNVSLNTTLPIINLGTDTSGDYIESITGSNGILITAPVSPDTSTNISTQGVLSLLNANGLPEKAGELIVSTGNDGFNYQSGEDIRNTIGLGATDSVDFNVLNLKTSLVLKDNDALENSITISAPNNLLSSYSIVLPDNDGSANEVLVTDGDGNLSWTTVESAAGTAVNSFAYITINGDQNSIIEADVSRDTFNIIDEGALTVSANPSNDSLTFNVSNITNDHISETAAISDTKLAKITSTKKVNLDAIDFDTSTVITEDLKNSDLFAIAEYDEIAETFNTKSITYNKIKTNLSSDLNSLVNLTTIGTQGQTTNIQSNLTISGNLIVSGEQTIVNGNTIQLDDNLIEFGLTNGQQPTVETVKDIGFIINRHDGTQPLKAAFYWNESNERFNLVNNSSENESGVIVPGSKSTLSANILGNVTGTVSDISNHDTDSLSEGASNLYFTQDRTRNALSVSGDLSYDNTTGNISFTQRTDSETRQLISVTDNGGDGSLSYDNTTGILSYTGPSAAEVRSHITSGTGVSITDGQISIGQSIDTTDDVTFNSVTSNLTGNVTGTVSDISNHDTDSLSEGTSNLYFTDSRSRSALSVSGDLSYDNTTGNISFTQRTDSETRQLISVTDNGGDGSLSYDNTTGVLSYTGPSAAEVRSHITSGTGVSITDGQISIGQSVDTTDNVTFNSVTSNLTGNVTGTVSDISNHDTDSLSEGTNNLYFTENRVHSSLSAGTGVSITSGQISIGQSIGVSDSVVFGDLSFNNEQTNVSSIVNSFDNVTEHISLPTALSVKSYIEESLNSHRLVVEADNVDQDSTDSNLIDLNISLGERLKIKGETGVISTSAPTSDVNTDDTNSDTLTISLVDNGIDLNKLSERSSSTMNVIGSQSGSTANIEIEVKSDDDMGGLNSSDSVLVTQKSVKDFVEGKIGRHGGMFKTELNTQSNDATFGQYDVIFSGAPIVRSHFGPFAFDLLSLVAQPWPGGSDFIFYGSTSYQSSDRHFEVLYNSTNEDLTFEEYDTVFTGADSTTP